MARSERTPIPQPDNRHMKLVCENKKVIDISYDRVTQYMEQNKEFHKNTDPYQEKAVFPVTANRSITIAGLGDGHLGAMSSNQELFKLHTYLIAATPNVYGVGLSNYIDAFLPVHHAGGKLDSPMPVLKEAMAMNDRLKKMGEGKMLGMVHSSCHEGWAETLAGIDLQQIMAMDTDIPLLENGGVVEIKFPNGKKFSLGLWHKAGRGGPGKNSPSWSHHANSRLGTTDAIMIGHSHVAEVEQAYFGEHPNRNEVAMIRTGSYKGNVLNEDGEITDRFQRSNSGRDGELGGQAVTYNPMTGDMRVHMNLLQAIKYQEQLNRVEPLFATGKIHEIWEAAKTIDSRIDRNK